MRFITPAASLAVAVGLVLVSSSVPASADPIVWNGPSITFTKGSFVDYTLPENQDRLTSNVWLTRLFARPLFNIRIESNPEDFVSPLDTEWAFGPTQTGDPGPITAGNFAKLEFSPFAVALNRAVGQNILSFGPGVLHLISDDIYLNIRFTSWGIGELGQGGSFSYIRATPGETPVPEPSSAMLLVMGGVVWLGRMRRSLRRS